MEEKSIFHTGENLDPGFEQREAKLERHCPNIVLFYLFWKRLGVDGLKQELKD